MIPLCHDQFSCFWKFPETAWRDTRSRQATHPNFSVFWVPLRNRLAVMNTRQATRVELIQLLCFYCSGRILIRKKPSFNGLGIIRKLYAFEICGISGQIG